VVVPKRPDESTRQYQDLIRRLDELTALVQARETPGPQVS
jgi:hypothetical protein